MLFVLFQIGEDWYALAARAVVEVLPITQLKLIPRAPAAVAGILNLRGVPVPVIDLSMLALGRSAPAVLSTRIILVQIRDQHGVPQFLGLLAEHATEILEREPSDFVSSGVRSNGALYLGPVAQDDRGLVQWIAIDKLLPAAVRDVLFRDDSPP